MISYRDMTFCSLSSTCAWSDKCSRAITEQVIEGAKKTGLPLSVSEFKCYTPKKEESNDGV
jgi:hypothetical protein